MCYFKWLRENLKWSFLYLFFLSPAMSMTVSEESLKIIMESSKVPTLMKIRSGQELKELEFNSINELYSPQLFYQSQYENKAFRGRSDLRSIYDGPQSYHQLGIKQGLPYGTSLQAAVISTSTQTNLSGIIPGQAKEKSVNNAVEFKFSFDLWKNFLGKIDQARLNGKEKAQKIALIKGEVQENQFKIALRRVYWRLVANEMSMIVSKKLLKAAETNANNVSLRYQDSAADEGDVARANSLVSARKGSILSLEFQKENLVRGLKEMLPILETENIDLGKINLEKTIDDVLICIGTISNLNTTPFEYTYLDEILDLLKDQLQNELLVENSHDKIDVQLLGSLYRDGQDENMGKAKEDFNRGNRTDYSVGISVTIPLGEKKRLTKENKTLLKNLTLSSEEIELRNQMQTQHSFIVKSIRILVQAMQEQASAKTDLEKRLTSMRKKYQQGRATIGELVSDEGDLLNVELKIIETKLLIVETLLSYFEIFSKTECPFNKF